MKSINSFSEAIERAQINGLIKFQVTNFVEQKQTLKEKLNSFKVADYPTLQSQDFDDVQEKIENGIWEIYTNTATRDAKKLLQIISTNEEAKVFSLQFWLYPIFVSIFFIVVSFATSKFWLLAGVLAFPLSLATTTKGSPILNLLTIASLIGVIILLFMGNFWATSIPLAYILLSANILTYEKKFREIIIKRAFEIEEVFLFLLVTSSITLYKTEEGKLKRIEI